MKDRKKDAIERMFPKGLYPTNDKKDGFIVYGKGNDGKGYEIGFISGEIYIYRLDGEFENQANLILTVDTN